MSHQVVITTTTIILLYFLLRKEKKTLKRTKGLWGFHFSWAAWEKRRVFLCHMCVYFATVLSKGTHEFPLMLVSELQLSFCI